MTEFSNCVHKRDWRHSISLFSLQLRKASHGAILPPPRLRSCFTALTRHAHFWGCNCDTSSKPRMCAARLCVLVVYNKYKSVLWAESQPTNELFCQSFVSGPTHTSIFLKALFFFFFPASDFPPALHVLHHWSFSKNTLWGGEHLKLSFIIFAWTGKHTFLKNVMPVLWGLWT